MPCVLEQRTDEEEKGKDLDASEDHEKGTDDLRPCRECCCCVHVYQPRDTARRCETGDRQGNRLDGGKVRQRDEEAADRKDGGEEKREDEHPSDRVDGDRHSPLPHGEYHARVEGALQLCPREREQYEQSRNAETARRRAHAAADGGEKYQEQYGTAVVRDRSCEQQPIRGEKGNSVEKSVGNGIHGGGCTAQQGRHGERQSSGEKEQAKGVQLRVAQHVHLTASAQELSDREERKRREQCAEPAREHQGWRRREVTRHRPCPRGNRIEGEQQSREDRVARREIEESRSNRDGDIEQRHLVHRARHTVPERTE